MKTVNCFTISLTIYLNIKKGAAAPISSKLKYVYYSIYLYSYSSYIMKPYCHCLTIESQALSVWGFPAREAVRNLFWDLHSGQDCLRLPRDQNDLDYARCASDSQISLPCYHRCQCSLNSWALKLTWFQPGKKLRSLPGVRKPTNYAVPTQALRWSQWIGKGVMAHRRLMSVAEMALMHNY